MEGITSLEAALQVLPGLGLARSHIDGGPFRRKLRAPLKAPVGKRFGDILSYPLVIQVLEQAPAHDFADFRLIVRDQVLRHAPHDLGDPLLPLDIPIRHLHLAAGQTDGRSASARAGHGDGQVLDEGMEMLRHAAMAVHEVQDLIEQDQHRTAGGLEHPAERLRTGRRRLGSGSECGNALLPRKLPRQIEPGGLASFPRVPGVADKDTHPGLGYRLQARRDEKIPNAGKPVRLGAVVDEVVQRRQRMGLAAAELRDEREHRAVLAVSPASRRSTIPACSLSTRVKQVRLKNFSGSR